jgi:hypothetical protein
MTSSVASGVNDTALLGGAESTSPTNDFSGDQNDDRNPYLSLIRKSQVESIVSDWLFYEPYLTIGISSCQKEIESCNYNSTKSNLSELFYIPDLRRRYRFTNEDTKKIIKNVHECFMMKQQQFSFPCTAAIAYTSQISRNGSPSRTNSLPIINRFTQLQIAKAAIRSFEEYLPAIAYTFHSCRDIFQEKLCTKEVVQVSHLLTSSPSSNTIGQRIQALGQCYLKNIKSADDTCIQSVLELDSNFQAQPHLQATSKPHKGTEPPARNGRNRDQSPVLGIFILLGLIAVMVGMIYFFWYWKKTKQQQKGDYHSLGHHHHQYELVHSASLTDDDDEIHDISPTSPINCSDSCPVNFSFNEEISPATVYPLPVVRISPSAPPKNLV